MSLLARLAHWWRGPEPKAGSDQTVLSGEPLGWPQLQHAYGPATDVPRWLADLASDETPRQKDGLDQLWGHLFHQGSRYSATRRAIPVLVDLLEAPGDRDRAAILDLLVHLAVGYPEDHLPDGAPAAEFFRLDTWRREPTANPRQKALFLAGLELEQQCYDAVGDGVPCFLALLSADPPTRRMACFALAWFPAAASRSVPALRNLLTRLVTEDSDEADLVTALSALALLGDGRSAAVRAFADHPSLTVRATVAAASLLALPSSAAPAAVDLLALASFIDGGNITSAEVPFERGRLAARHALELLGRHDLPTDPAALRALAARSS